MEQQEREMQTQIDDLQRKNESATKIVREQDRIRKSMQKMQAQKAKN
jgi:hypothetical protein